MVSIGLLMVSVTSATALAEERAHGSLDLLMTTPLSSGAHCFGKMVGVVPRVPILAVLPGVLALGLGLKRGQGLAAIPFAALIASLVIAYGAVITSLGLAIATWQPRLGRAVAFSVAIYVIVTVVYPAIAITTARLGPRDTTVLWPSPFFGMFLPMGWLAWDLFMGKGAHIVMFVWIAVTVAIAYVILRVTIAVFDHLLGRMRAVRTAIKDEPGPRSLAMGRPRQAHRSPS